VFVPLVLLMFVVPYALSSFRKRQGKPYTPTQADGRDLVNQARMSIVSTAETTPSSAAVLYRNA
jgi:hypothetical protein